MAYFSLPPDFLRNKQQTTFPNSMIDILFDYDQFLSAADKNNSITKSGPKTLKKVAIIGAGASGLVSAYELARIDNINVTVLEASDRIGGRMYSIYNNDQGYNSKVFEMGCMRFPPTSKTLFHYLNKFNLKPAPDFPDPGKVPTTLFYENQPIEWIVGDSAPNDKDFKRIGEAFNGMIIYLLGDVNKPNTLKPEKLFDFWKIYETNPTRKNKIPVIRCWQKIIDQYKDTTYYKAVFDLSQLLGTEILPDAPHQKPWTVEDMNRFGALGIGSGGFGPLFEVNFVEIIRLMANGWESEQTLLIDGIGALVGAFKKNIEDAGGTIFCNSKVTRVSKKDNKYIIQINEKEQEFDAVILATTTRAMEYIDLTLTEILKQKPKVAIRNLHLMNSSKLFVSTKSKFWHSCNNKAGKTLPQNIQTDESLRGLYCLNYDGEDTKGMGVVLISYVWGDDSSKLLALTPEQRFEQFISTIRQVNVDFAEALANEANYETMACIDWENTEHYYGAFKLNYPGQEQMVNDAFFQFKTNEEGIVMTGDSISWAGGWLEGAMTCSLNSACSIAQFLGAELINDSPMTIEPMYVYDNPPDVKNLSTSSDYTRQECLEVKNV